MPESIAILIVDDEKVQREILAGYLKKKRYILTGASSVTEALVHLQRNHFDIILTDYKMGDRTGVDLLKEVRRISPETAVVLMTAFGTIEGAVEAIREGAYDYLSKPIELDALDLLLNRIIERTTLLSENKLLKEQLTDRYSFDEIISSSGAMESVLQTAGRVAQSKAPVLVRGESGTGKELIAKAIHFNSPRREKPFIAVNCAALNVNLLESELFGHEKGSFTGAERQHKGRFETADGGTLFLDEIGDIPLATQVRLLRVLQEQQFERVGGTQTVTVDVRVIAATHKDLEAMMKSGVFREDLFFRLSVVPIEIPPLRNRREDIPPLLEHFLIQYAQENRRKKLSFSKEAWEILLRYEYPGNIRELENIVQRAAILSRKEIITTEDLPKTLQNPRSEVELTEPATPRDLSEQVERLEKELIFEALRSHHGNQSQAARQLGISERNLRYRLKKWGVKKK